MSLHPESVNSLVNGDHGSPFDLLGVHRLSDTAFSVRVFRPSAKQIWVVNGDEKSELTQVHEAGLFEATLTGGNWAGHQYYFETETGETFHDPYAFAPQITDLDLYLLREGRHFRSYDKLGAHLVEIDGVKGVRFVLWAPNAYRVSVIGEFNNWDARVHPMRVHGDSGFWELFIPDLPEWTLYKYDLRCRNGYRTEKTDPYGFFTEMRPRTSSIVVDLSTYEWSDSEWMAAREQSSAEEILKRPMSIYEVHLGSWRRKNGYEWLTYHELADELVAYLKEMNYTHVELMPVSEYPFDGSWGYQVTGYFAPTSRYGTPQDFMYLVDQCHQNGIGVILDWVPAHFPKDGSALSYFDGTHLYEHADPRQGEHPDWGTYIFNYGRTEVRNFLIANALFWLKEYHIDGLRVDAVSSMLYLDFGRKAGEWIPNIHGGNENLEAIRFIQEANAVIHTECQGVMTIAEESTSWGLVSRPTFLGGLGFTFKWNMGWMHDVLDYMEKDPIYRRYHHNQMTFSTMYAYSENFILSLSHDEVVHLKGSIINKMAGDYWQKFASVRLLYGYQIAHPGKVLTFMGQEIGQWREWSEERSLDWNLVENYPLHQGIQQWVKEMNHFYQEQPALYEQDYDPAGFQWAGADDAENSTFTFLRFAEDRRDCLIFACNFTPVPRFDYRIGVPEAGFYAELMNSDSQLYGGSNLGNDGGRWSESGGWQGHGQFISVTIPALAIVVFKLKQGK